MTTPQLALMSVLALGGLFITFITPVSAAKNPQAVATAPSSNQPPIANAGGVYRGSAGGPVQFNGTASSAPDGSIINYAWNFGDNTDISSPKHEAPAHSYANEGTYTVTLTVTDDQGATASATTAIIGGATPIVGDAAESARLSLSLNGNGAYVEVPNTETLNDLETFRAEAWVKTNSAANQQGVMERYRWEENDDGGFALRLILGGKVLFGTVHNAQEHEFVTSATSLMAGDWHHVAGVFDEREMRVYVDGTLDGARNSTLYPAAGKASLKTGARGDDASNTFDGLIDDAKLSRGVVYQGSFKPEKRLTAGGLTDADAPATTWGLWTFEDKQAIDLSGSKNDMELKEGAEFSEEVNDYTYPTGNAPNSTAVQLNFDDLDSGTIVDSLYLSSKKNGLFYSPGEANAIHQITPFTPSDVVANHPVSIRYNFIFPNGSYNEPLWTKYIHLGFGSFLPSMPPGYDYLGSGYWLLTNATAGPGLIRFRVTTITPNTNADLAVTISDAPDPVVADNNVAYTVHVRNNGPQSADNVGLVYYLPAELNFVSASVTSGSGTCAEQEENVYCQFGTLSANTSVSVNIVATALESANSPAPASGRQVSCHANVGSSDEEFQETNRANNNAAEITTVLPNPNKRPSVTVTSPLPSSLHVGPANLTLTATATDQDGTVTRVDFYDQDTLIGTGVASSGNTFSYSWANVNYGAHIIHAIATDNGGRKGLSTPVKFFVNGLATINISNPANNQVIAPSTAITVTANINSPIAIDEIEFHANLDLIGTVEPNSRSQYSVTWTPPGNGKYLLQVTVKDVNDIETISQIIPITVTNRPTVSIIEPANSATFASHPTINVKVNAEDDDGPPNKVEVYANGTLIGSASNTGNNQYTLVWPNVPDGFHSIVAVATDVLGVTNTSAAITIAVNQPAPPAPGEHVWMDDALPPGATGYASGNDVWQWVNSNPVPILGNAAHQSKIAAGTHLHNFSGATLKLPVNAGDTLYTYIFIDLDHVPREIMLEWSDGTPCVRRTFRGKDLMGNSHQSYAFRCEFYAA